MSLELAIQESIATAAPAIGQQWPGQGGIYAGLARGRNGAPDYHLIVGPELTAAAWKNVTQQATDLVIDGHADFSLPFRAEQSLQFANVPELFEGDWYWSCEEHASGSDYAWIQLFDDGNQYYSHESGELRARAVRRVKISQDDAQA